MAVRESRAARNSAGGRSRRTRAHHARAVFLGDRPRAVAAEGVEHHHVVAPSHRLEAVREVDFLVQREYDDRDSHRPWLPHDRVPTTRAGLPATMSPLSTFSPPRRALRPSRLAPDGDPRPDEGIRSDPRARPDVDRRLQQRQFAGSRNHACPHIDGRDKKSWRARRFGPCPGCRSARRRRWRPSRRSRYSRACRCACPDRRARCAPTRAPNKRSTMRRHAKQGRGLSRRSQRPALHTIRQQLLAPRILARRPVGGIVERKFGGRRIHRRGGSWTREPFIVFLRLRDSAIASSAL